MEFITIIFFFVLLVLFFWIGYKLGAFKSDKYWEEQIPEHRKDAVEKSRAVLSGLFSEQLSPYMPDFPFSPTEARFIGKPVDFLVFRGMDEKNIKEVVFVEVKSKNSKLSSSQKQLKDVIEKKKVKWHEYKVPGSNDDKKFEERN